MSIRTNEAFAYWLVPMNATGIPGRKSSARPTNSLGPDGTTDNDVTGIVLADLTLNAYGTFSISNIRVPAIEDVQIENQNTAGITELHAYLVYVAESDVDKYIQFTGGVPYDSATPTNSWSLTLAFTSHGYTPAVGDFILINDPREDVENDDVGPDHLCRYEAGQVTAVSGGNLTLRRHYPGQPSPSRDRFSTFEMLMSTHAAGVKAYPLKFQHFSWKFTSGADPLHPDSMLPPRVDGVWPSACVICAIIFPVNYYGIGPVTNLPGFTDFNLSVSSKEKAPGKRTLNGAAYTFRQDGDVVVDDHAEQQIHDWASIRTIYATVTEAPTGDDIQVKVSYKYQGDSDWTEIQTLTIPVGSLVSYTGFLPTDRRMPFQEGYTLVNPVYGPEYWPTPIIKGDALIAIDVMQIGINVAGQQSDGLHSNVDGDSSQFQNDAQGGLVQSLVS